MRRCALSGLLFGLALLSPRLSRASGSGDMGEAFHDLLWYGAIPVGIVVPEYSLHIDDAGSRSGLQWEVPFLLATRDLEPPVWGGGASISWYPGAGEVMLRGTARVLVPIRDELWKTEVPGVTLGLGGFWYDDQVGPRVEVRLRYWCWAGLFLSGAWEPVVSPEFSNGAEVSAGLEIPIPFGM